MVGAATALRVGTGCLELIAQRTPPLVGLVLRASAGGPDTEHAEAMLRDELVALARESAELSWRELRRGVDRLDASTRPPQPPAATANGRPRRPYRVKP
jgi:hypothetical protein